MPVQEGDENQKRVSKLFQAVCTEDDEGADAGMEVNRLPLISNCVFLLLFCYTNFSGEFQ